MKLNRNGQVTAEVAVLFAFVIAGFVFMGFYLQRAAQGSTKANTDAIGSQFQVSSDWNTVSESASSERVVGNTVITTSDSCSEASIGIGNTVATALADCTAANAADGGWGYLPNPI